MKTPAPWFKGPKFFSSSISNRIIIPYALLTLVLAAFGTFVVTYLVAGSFEERFKNQLLSAGRVVSDEIVNRENLRLEVERSVANTQGVTEHLINRDASQLNTLIAPIMANSQNIDSIVLVDAQGKEMLRLQRNAATSNEPADTTLNSGADFASLTAVNRVLTDPTGALKDVQIAHDPGSNEIMIYTVGPARTNEGTVGAVLVGTYLSREINNLHNLALANITLFDEQGKIIISTLVPDKEEAAKVFSVFTPQRFKQVIKQQEVTLLDEVDGVTDVEASGQTYRLAYAPFTLRGRVYGVYAVALPTNFITETNNLSRFWLSGVFTGGVVAVLIIGYAVSRRIIKPIISLVQTSQEIARGNLDRRTGLKGDDEIGILARTFDEMTVELQKKTIALREEASKLNAILNSIADGVIVQDLAGRIITTNPAAEKILEIINFNEMGSMQFEAELVDTGQSTSEAQAKPLLKQLTGLQFHETHRFEMGRQTLSALSAPVLTLEGEPLGAVIVLRDISREVEAERLKDDFITSMSHELRTPPTAIKGYNDLLRMVAANKLSERELGFINAIEQNVNDLLNIIQQMLDLSQIDAGTLGIDQETQNLLEIIETEADQWAGQMEDKELSFSVHLPEEPIWVIGDWSRLTQVIHNLLSNAYNYTLPGGRVEILATSTANEVQVSITDTGVGIADNDQRFLFTRFFRAIHEESTFEVSGAGLGLYMSRAIIEAHRGRIWIKSILHEGSTFSFALPVVSPDLVDTAEMVEYAHS